MADDISLNPGSGGALIGADDVGGVMYQRIKVGFGLDGSFSEVCDTVGLPTQVTPLANTRILNRYLDTIGDGSGVKNASVDHSAAAADYMIKPPAGEIYQINRLIIQIRDSGTFSAEKYGALASLANGIQVLIVNDAGTILNLTDDVPIKGNTDWTRCCYDTSLHEHGAGDNFLAGRWSFFRSGSPLVLSGDNTERLVVRINDDLSGLVGHYFFVNGWRSA